MNTIGDGVLGHEEITGCIKGDAVRSGKEAGTGVKGGVVHGQSDELGDNVAKDLVTVHDFQATILHLLGIDHERLTYRHAGRNFRLTDVHGNVV